MKKKVAETQGEGFDVELQTIVYCGKTLDDGQTLGGAKYEPEKHIVLSMRGPTRDILMSKGNHCIHGLW